MLRLNICLSDSVKSTPAAPGNTEEQGSASLSLCNSSSCTEVEWTREVRQARAQLSSSRSNSDFLLQMTSLGRKFRHQVHRLSRHRSQYQQCLHYPSPRLFRNLFSHKILAKHRSSAYQASLRTRANLSGRLHLVCQPLSVRATLRLSPLEARIIL